jgi:hypothetical protein
MTVILWAGLLASLALLGQAAASHVSYHEARPIVEAMPGQLPAELKDKPPPALQAAWDDWIAGRDAAVRARLARGDEDSIVNFLLLGTTFTTQARVLNQDATPSGLKRVDTIVRARIDDLIAAVGAPNENERLAFVRLVLQRNGINAAADPGGARRFFQDAVARAVAEVDEHVRSLQAARSRGDVRGAYTERMAYFSARGLSSDTSLLPSYALDRALAAIKSRESGPMRRIKRVAIIGPGLDFIDKVDGYDLYPEQTIQPFLAIDSLVRLGFSTLDDVRVTTFDVSPRVNHHLDRARARAQVGTDYRLRLPMDMARQWSAEYTAYWRSAGDRIASKPADPVRQDGYALEVRPVDVRADVVALIDPRDLNVVYQRPPLSADERFDLVIATNVLVYYGIFEQALALSNIAATLRPGGLLLSNDSLPQLQAIPLPQAGFEDVVYAPGPGYAERLVWYRRGD